MSCVKIINGIGQEIVVGDDITNLTYYDDRIKKNYPWIKVGSVSGFDYKNQRYSGAGPVKQEGEHPYTWRGYRNNENKKYYEPPSECKNKKPSQVNTFVNKKNSSLDKEFQNPIAQGF